MSEISKSTVRNRRRMAHRAADASARPLRLAFGMAMMLWLVAATAPAQSPRLFKSESFRSLSAAQPDGGEPWILWSKTLEIDPSVLKAFIPQPGERLVFNISDELAFETVLEAVEQKSPEYYAWRGRIEGLIGGEVSVSVVDGVIVAEIEAPPYGQFEVRYAADGVVEIRQIDPGLMPACEVATEHGIAVWNGGPAPALEAPAAGDPVIIDLLIVYSQAAVSGAGGISAIESLINLAVFDANTALSNSGIDAQFNVVHLAQVTFFESGSMNTDLNRLTSTGDGFIDMVHDWRDDFGADVVTLVTNHSGYSGIGWLMQGLSVGFAPYGFNVVNLGNLGALTLPHEIGHNMGCAHDLANSSVAGLYSYSYGWRWSADAYRSVMAYPPGSRQKHFSSPLVNHNSEPTGVADSADNALTLRNSMATVAAWRSTVTDPPIPGAQLANIATRGKVLTVDDVMIGGFIIEGTEPRKVLIQARGPSLTNYGVAGALPDPQLGIYSGQTQIASNDNWGAGGQVSEIQATGITPENSLEAAILMTLAPGPYTAIVSGKDGATGVGIVEVFDVDDTGGDAELINIATRGKVLTGDEVMIGGFIINGTESRTVLIRARGPSLTDFGVTGALSNPQLSIFSGSMQMAGNDNWGSGGQSSEIQATGLAPDNALEAAVLLTLAPGPYTAIVEGVGGSTGVGIVEVFDVTE